MPSNSSGIQVGYLAGLYSDPMRIGWLISPGGWRRPPSWLPVALDNGAFGAFTRGEEFDVAAWKQHIELAHTQCQPLWMVVPDVVADRTRTMEAFRKWQPYLAEKYPNTPLAFAVQDGMTKDDVPPESEVVFIGGTTEWKWKNMKHFTTHFPRVHAARVGTERLLHMAHNAGCESADSTGFTRGGEHRIAGLHRYLEETTNGKKHNQLELL